jgi:hypothetical protein
VLTYCEEEDSLFMMRYHSLRYMYNSDHRYSFLIRPVYLISEMKLNLGLSQDQVL